MSLNPLQTNVPRLDRNDSQIIFDDNDDLPIPFFIYITKFLDLLERAYNKKIELQHKITVIVKRHFDVVVAFFKHIFTRPLIDPFDSSFIDVLDRFSARIAVLKDEVNNVPQLFHNRSLLNSDLQKMYRTHHQIDETFNQLQGFLAEVREYKVPLPIEEDIFTLTEAYKDLKDKLKRELDTKEVKILEAFIEIYEFLSPHTINIPKEIRKELIQCGAIMAETLNPNTPLKQRFLSVFEKLKSGERTDVLTNINEENYVKGMVATAPLRLKFDRNSCYFHAALQAIFCMDETRKLAHQNLKEEPLPARELTQWQIEERKRDLIRRKEIQAHLLNTLKVLTPQQDSSFSHLQYILTVSDSSDNFYNPARILREKILNSGLVFDYSDPTRDRYEQQDSLALIEVLMKQILCQGFMTQNIWSTQAAPGRVFVTRKEEQYGLQISLNQPNLYKLQDLVDSYFTADVSPNEKVFIPKEGIVVNESEAGEIVKPEFTIPALINPNMQERDMREEAENQARESINRRYRVSQFEIMPSLVTLPDIMVLHLKRFLTPVPNRMEKNTKEVLLPNNGIIDFEKNCEPEEEGSKNTKYEIMGYVVHQGAYAGGHYTANVKIGKKFYHCNDTDQEPYKEIQSQDFYDEKQAYAIFLRRIKDTDR